MLDAFPARGHSQAVPLVDHDRHPKNAMPPDR